MEFIRSVISAMERQTESSVMGALKKGSRTQMAEVGVSSYSFLWMGRLQSTSQWAGSLIPR